MASGKKIFDGISKKYPTMDPTIKDSTIKFQMAKFPNYATRAHLTAIKIELIYPNSTVSFTANSEVKHSGCTHSDETIE